MNKSRPPMDMETEQGLLGSILVGGLDAASKVMAVLPEQAVEAFTLSAHADIWRVIVALYDARTPIDMLTFKAEAQRQGSWDRVGGAEALADLAESFPNAANAEYYAIEVKRTWNLRRMMALAHSINEQVASGDADPSAIAAQALESLAGSAKTDQSTAADAEQVLDDWIAEVESRDEKFKPYRTTGLENLDAIIGGTSPGDLVIIAARPSMGKTALGINMAVNMSDAEYPVLFVSLEMTRERLMVRIMSRLADLDARELRTAKAKDAELLDKVRRYRNEVKRMKMRIMDTKGRSQTGARTLAYVMAVIRRDVIDRGTKAVFVDYLGLLDIQGKSNEARYFRVQQMSAAFKAIALELGISVFLVCQLNREVAKRGDTRPQMSDLRESGAIEQDADMILLLHRPAYYDPHADFRVLEYAECIVAKNRDGETGVAALRWTAKRQKFASMDADDAQRCRDILSPGWVKKNQPTEEQAVLANEGSDVPW